MPDGFNRLGELSRISGDRRDSKTVYSQVDTNLIDFEGVSLGDLSLDFSERFGVQHAHK